MKFACSTLAAPNPELRALAGRAREMGYDGIELSMPVSAFDAAGLEIACIASAIEMSAGRRKRAAGSAELKALIETAASVNCRRVRILGARLAAGQNANSLAAEMGQWLLPAAHYAGERGVTILVQNALAFRKSRDLWMLLESIGHPNVAACWDLTAATQAGESPYVSVPTLNTRIQYAIVREGDAALENFLTRLRGIGYGGYVTVEGPLDRLGEALRKLRDWTKPQAGKPEPKGKAVRVKERA
jgi:sugar phosphate isomerase/epimerase